MMRQDSDTIYSWQGMKFLIILRRSRIIHSVPHLPPFSWAAQQIARVPVSNELWLLFILLT
jgi:hypothetical protein